MQTLLRQNLAQIFNVIKASLILFVLLSGANLCKAQSLTDKSKNVKSGLLVKNSQMTLASVQGAAPLTFTGQIDAVLSTGMTFGVNPSSSGYAASPTPPSGVLNVGGIPTGASVEKAYFYLTGPPPPSGDLTFQNSLIGTNTRLGDHSAVWDVTQQVKGNGPYGFSCSGMSAYSVCLLVIYRHESLPVRKVIINESMGTLWGGTRSVVFPDVEKGNSRLLMLTGADNTFEVGGSDQTGETIVFNGVTIGGPIDNNLGGLGGSLFDIRVPTIDGSNTVTINSPGDAIVFPFFALVSNGIKSVNLSIDSNNDDTIDESESGDDEASENASDRVGAIVPLNVDDSEGSSGSEDNLKAFKINASAPQIKPLVLDISEGRERIKIWKDAQKSQEITTFPYTFSQAQQNQNADFEQTLYIEGDQYGVAKLKLYREGAESLQDEVKLFVGNSDIILQDASTVGEDPIVALAHLPADTKLDFVVYKNGSVFNRLSKNIDAGFSTGFVLDTSSSIHSPGDVYKVTATADQGHLRYESEPCEIIAGQPHSISSALSKQSVISDGQDKINLEVTVKDQYGNLVDDETAVSFYALDRMNTDDADDDLDISGINPSTDVVTKNGKTSVEVTSAIVGDILLLVSSDEAELEVTIPSTPVTAVLSSGDSTLRIDQDQTTTVSVQTNATDGSHVLWTISNTQDPEQVTKETVVSNGQSSITVSSEDAYVGDCWVTSTIASKIAGHKLSFDEEADIKVTFDHHMIIGDITQDTVEDYEYISPTSATGLAKMPLPLSANSHITVEAKPQTRYEVVLGGASDGVVRVTGTDLNGSFVTDANGIAVLSLESRGILDPCKRSARSIDFQVVESEEPSINNVQWNSTAHAKTLEYHKGDATLKTIQRAKLNSRSQTVKVIDKKTGTALLFYAKDMAWAFFGADFETLPGMGANVAGGFAVVGDIGAIVKNLYRMGPWSSVSPNKLELSLTVLGLASDVGYLAGGAPGIAANGVINTVRAFVIKFRGFKFGEIVVELILDIAKGTGNLAKYRIATQKATALSFWQGFLTFAREMFFNGGFRNMCSKILNTPKAAYGFLKTFISNGAGGGGGDWFNALRRILAGKWNNLELVKFIKFTSKPDIKALVSSLPAQHRVQTYYRLFMITGKVSHPGTLMSLLSHSKEFSKGNFSVVKIIKCMAVMTKHPALMKSLNSNIWDAEPLIVKFASDATSTTKGWMGNLFEISHIGTEAQKYGGALRASLRGAETGATKGTRAFHQELDCINLNTGIHDCIKISTDSLNQMFGKFKGRSLTKLEDEYALAKHYVSVKEGKIFRGMRLIISEGERAPSKDLQNIIDKINLANPTAQIKVVRVKR